VTGNVRGASSLVAHQVGRPPASPSCSTTSAPICRRRPTPVGEWARANNVELAYLHSASWLNRIEAQFTALHHFCLDGMDHESHEAHLLDRPDDVIGQRADDRSNVACPNAM
jgi:hypothetical protein